MLTSATALPDPTRGYLTDLAGTLITVTAYGGTAAIAETVLDGVRAALTPTG